MGKEICHVCKKEKKPYVVFITDDMLSFLEYEQAREDGPICQRCDQYYAMTAKFKDPTDEEFEIAKKSSWFARMMLRWWEKDKKLNIEEAYLSEDKRDWEGTKSISRWCREELLKNLPKQNKKVKKKK